MNIVLVLILSRFTAGQTGNTIEDDENGLT
jgi:hypothetical protein